jgi:hypothetical protein
MTISDKMPVFQDIETILSFYIDEVTIALFWGYISE